MLCFGALVVHCCAGHRYKLQCAWHAFHHCLRNAFDCIPAGLPIGLQLIGRPWAEADLLYAGSVLEKAVQGSVKRPKLFCTIGGSAS